jgi:hypothetical protein
MVNPTFSEKLDLQIFKQLSKLDPETGCINWQGEMSHNGYGRYEGNYAHRVAFKLKNGYMPVKPQIVYHTCGNPRCVNPEHLKAGTSSDKTRAAISRGKWRGNTGRHEKHKINKETADLIRSLYNVGTFKQIELADLFNITQPQISQICNFKCFAKIPNIKPQFDFRPSVIDPVILFKDFFVDLLDDFLDRWTQYAQDLTLAAGKVVIL